MVVVCPEFLSSIYGIHSPVGINGYRVLWKEIKLSMQGENESEVEYSIDELLLLVQTGQEVGLIPTLPMFIFL
jgi:hypothetical protein